MMHIYQGNEMIHYQGNEMIHSSLCRQFKTESLLQLNIKENPGVRLRFKLVIRGNPKRYE